MPTPIFESTVDSQQAADYAAKNAFRRIRYKTVDILRSSFMLIGGAFTTADCVRAEQRIYDARTEALMVPHAIKIRQLFEE